MVTLIIRPHKEAQKTLDLLKERGIKGHVQPTLGITPFPYDIATINLPSIQAIVITSQNALHNLTDHRPFQVLPLYCIGKATADLATFLGYQDIHSADGNSTDLLSLIQRSCPSQIGPLLHITCPQAPTPFTKQLIQAGYQAENLMVYNALLMDDLQEDTKVNLQKGAYDNVLFFSPRGAKHFVHLCQQSRLVDQLSSLSAFCLSPAIAQAIEKFDWQSIFISSKPKLSTLINLLCRQKKS